jgi:hypothetical protein
MKTKMSLALMVLMVVFGSTLCLALMSISDKGHWPKSWPAELEPFRDRAKTIEVAHGIQETVYEIPFDDRDEFEKAWPAILKLKSDGGVLILEKTPSTDSTSGSTATTGVRILSPPGGISIVPAGIISLSLEPPWTTSAYQPAEKLSDIFNPPTGVMNRVRIDIVLIIDGEIVDLNRIPLPSNTSIVDHRFIDKNKP